MDNEYDDMGNYFQPDNIAPTKFCEKCGDSMFFLEGKWVCFSCDTDSSDNED